LMSLWSVSGRMAEIRCPNCGRLNPAGTRYCKGCSINLGDYMRKDRSGKPIYNSNSQRPKRLAGWRYDLLKDLRGRVLEIGARWGANFQYYPREVEVIALDIDFDSLHSIQQEFRNFEQGAGLIAGDAQRLPFANHSFDAVVGTLVFCSIPNPALALAEIQRILKPGGRLYTIDHVRSTNPVLGKFMDMLASPYKWASGGCNINRHTEETLIAAGYTIHTRREAMLGIMRWIISEPAPN
jgi:SAM-dependent methyltransferase